MSEQHPLLAADPAADLHDDVFAVIGIFRKEQKLQFMFQLIPAGHGIFQFVLCQFPHLGIIHEALGIVHGRNRLLIAPEGGDHRFQFSQFPRAAGIGFRIGIYLRLLHSLLQFYISVIEFI